MAYYFIERMYCTMAENQQKTDKIQDIRLLEFYRVIGEGYKAMQDGRANTIEDVREKMKQQKLHRNIHQSQNVSKPNR